MYSQAGGVEVFYVDANNVQIYNNTIITTSAAPVHINSGITKAQVKNNIIYGGRQIIDDGTDTSFATNLCDIAGTGCTLTSDPKFENAAANDFRLQEKSPAINAGTALDAGLTDVSGIARPQGDRYDIGAYEYQSPKPPQIGAPPRNLRIVE